MSGILFSYNLITQKTQTIMLNYVINIEIGNDAAIADFYDYFSFKGLKYEIIFYHQ